jgi:D-amino-acid dehydrogenase
VALTEQQHDVAIVGAGLAGVSAAYYLARSGVDVVVLERNQTSGSECSYGNAGLITPSHSMPLAGPESLRLIPRWLIRDRAGIYIKPRLSLDLLRFGVLFARHANTHAMLGGMRNLRDLTRESKKQFEELLIEESLEVGYQTNGLMNVSRTQAGFQQLVERARLLEREGFQPEILSPSHARQLEPRLRDDITGAVFWAEDAHCDPHRFVCTLAEAASRRGAHFRFGCEVTKLHLGNDRRVSKLDTTSGSLRAKHVVLAAGAWTVRLARSAGLRIPLEAAKGYHADVDDSEPIRIPMIFHEHTFAATPLGNKLRLAGTMEFIGLDDELDRSRAGRLLTHARLYLENLSGDDLSAWSGLRSCTPDSLPLIGRSSVIPNLIFATGQGMLGLTLAPVTGSAVAALVTGEETDLSIHSLSPGRFRA